MMIVGCLCDDFSVDECAYRESFHRVLYEVVVEILDEDLAGAATRETHKTALGDGGGGEGGSGEGC